MLTFVAMETKLIKVIVSSDSSPRFINFWPIVAASWISHFKLNPLLTLVSTKSEFSNYRDALSKYGEIVFIERLKNIPIENQSKMARWYHACTLDEEIASIEDIDTIFLQSNYLLNKWKYFESHSLLGIGSDVTTYSEDRKLIPKFPASNFTGKGNLFAKLFGYQKGMSFEDFLEIFRGSKELDELEDPFNSAQKFSDESLIRSLRVKKNFSEILIVPRSVNVKTQWLDRSWWPNEGVGDVRSYICVNFPRPLFENRESCHPILSKYFPSGYPWIIEKNVSTLSKLNWVINHYKNTQFYYRLKNLWNRVFNEKF